MTQTANPIVTKTTDGEFHLVAAATVPGLVIDSLAACAFDEYAAYDHYVANDNGVRGVGYTARLIDGTNIVVITDHTA